MLGEGMGGWEEEGRKPGGLKDGQEHECLRNNAGWIVSKHKTLKVKMQLPVESCK